VSFLTAFKSAIGAGPRNIGAVGGSLGYRVNERLPTEHKRALEAISRLPLQTNERQILNETERAAMLHHQSVLLERLHKQRVSQRGSLLKMAQTQVEDLKDALTTADKLAFTHANFLQFLRLHGLNQGQAEAEVRGCDRAYDRANKLFGGL